jgi:HK97 family phage major capsid protein
MDTLVKTWIEERANLAEQMHALMEKASAEKRALNAEEEGTYDKMFERVSDLTKQIEKREAHERTMTALGKPTETRVPPAPLTPENEGRLGARSTKEYGEAFKGYLRTGEVPDRRALSWGVETGGGALAPETFITTLLKELDNATFIRRLATVQTLTVGDTLGVPMLTADPADADWTSELLTGSEDATMAFGKRDMRPHPLAKRIKVSNTLIQRAALPVEAIVRERLGYKFAVTEEKAFLTGTGASQPLGLFVASTDGIATTYDIAGSNTATEIAADTLFDVIYGLPPQYWPKAAWVGHRDWVKRVSKLKDGESRYMWSASLVAGQPNTLLGFPVYMSEYAPNTFTSAQYVALFGDYSRYWIVDVLSMTVQRLAELYAETNQVGFIGRLEVDGAPVWGNAFRRMKMGT